MVAQGTETTFNVLSNAHTHDPILKIQGHQKYLSVRLNPCSSVDWRHWHRAKFLVSWACNLEIGKGKTKLPSFVPNGYTATPLSKTSKRA
jgi:hypothetical protein